MTGYFNRIYYGLVSPAYMSIQTDTVTAGRLVITGSCAPPHNLDIKRIDDSEANGQTIVQCQRDKRTGRHLGGHIPRNRMPYTTQLHVTYVPLLNSLGEQAATSVGLPDTEHGNATYIYDSATDLDITYGPNPTAGATRQLKQLKLHVGKGGRESVKEIWYK